VFDWLRSGPLRRGRVVGLLSIGDKIALGGSALSLALSALQLWCSHTETTRQITDSRDQTQKQIQESRDQTRQQIEASQEQTRQQIDESRGQHREALDQASALTRQQLEDAAKQTNRQIEQAAKLTEKQLAEAREQSQRQITESGRITLRSIQWSQSLRPLAELLAAGAELESAAASDLDANLEWERAHGGGAAPPSEGSMPPDPHKNLREPLRRFEAAWEEVLIVADPDPALIAQHDQLLDEVKDIPFYLGYARAEARLANQELPSPATISKLVSEFHAALRAFVIRRRDEVFKETRAQDAHTPR
jgi:F0F1-type ATP synthase membrane subunit b/b'